MEVLLNGSPLRSVAAGFFFFFFYSPSRIICESHIRDVFRQAVHVVFSFDKKTKKENYGFVSEERERERGGKEEKW